MEFQKTRFFKLLKFIGIFYFIYIFLALISFVFSEIFQADASYYSRLDFFVIFVFGYLLLCFVPVYFFIVIFLLLFEKFKIKTFIYEKINKQNFISYFFVILALIVIPSYYAYTFIYKDIQDKNIKILNSYNREIETALKNNWDIPDINTDKDYLSTTFTCTLLNNGSIANINYANVKSKNGKLGIIELGIELDNIDTLKKVILSIQAIPDVYSVKRIQSSYSGSSGSRKNNGKQSTTT